MHSVSPKRRCKRSIKCVPKESSFWTLIILNGLFRVFESVFQKVLQVVFVAYIKETSFFSTTPFDSSCLCFRTNKQQRRRRRRRSFRRHFFGGRGLLVVFVVLFLKASLVYIYIEFCISSEQLNWKWWWRHTHHHHHHHHHRVLQNIIIIQ